MAGIGPFLVVVLTSGAGLFTRLQAPAPARWLLLAAGIGILLIVFGDLLWTALWDDKGAGPLSSRMMMTVWRGLRAIESQWSGSLSVGGPLILSVILLTWVGLIWAGWTLVFTSHETALIHVRSPDPPTLIGRIYFVAQAMFTMGNGDFYPAPGAWQIAGGLTTASGLLSVTLIVAYIVAVLQGVTAKRAFANSIMGVADRGEAFVRTGWNSESFDQFDGVINELSAELSHLAAQHKIYPVLHYYRSEKRRNSQVVAIIVFDEALTLLRFGVPPEHRPNDAVLETARSNAESYLQAFTETVEPADQTPPPPDLERLREAGIPTVSDEEFSTSLEGLRDRRRQSLAVVEESGRSWPTHETS